MGFKDWLLKEDDTRTGTKIGLYPSLADTLGQYPPLYSTPISADFITYYDIHYGMKPQGKDGIVPPEPHKTLPQRHIRFKYSVPGTAGIPPARELLPE